MKITAALVAASGEDFILSDALLDDPRPDEILVEIKAVGVCHTDIYAQHGGFPGFKPPAVLGHEGAGIVVATGDAVSKVTVGDRVALTFRHCGACRKCKSGHPAYCTTMPNLNYAGSRPDGTQSISVESVAVSSSFFGQSSFATHALTYETNVVRLDGCTDFSLAAPMGCGFQTGVGAVLNSFCCKAESALLVVGGGAVGLSAVIAAKYVGCETIMVVEPVAARRDLAMELGATLAIDPLAEHDWVKIARKKRPEGLDFVLDTTGRADALESAMQALGPQGVLGCVGIPQGGPPPGDIKAMVVYGQSIQGIIEGDSLPDVLIPQMIALCASGQLPLDRLITTYPFSQINQAVADQAAGLCVKAVLTLD
ncbi:NAD(P)-dependent alcohol dehydrogenase [Brevundimonas sp.]|uniref:NAD(P)-dependent alcohol dehydrogenase n=1 Tax=Brevundimonas sp. TaxID=1871086 RepID=UPI001A2947B9|nr:NAD(P)-dependent alcohol dehydrogenase [Brevundimonas sp.]MBJ7483884.1 NAD(P)-dependent alcohol dehydrogenase [Brevundimonas sp.]